MTGSYHARQVIVASGAKLKMLGVPGEAEFEGRGVSKCADCDGPMFQNETVAVIGGGDSALQEAGVLTHYCGKVLLIHRGTAFSAQPRFVEQVKANPKIEVRFGSTVEAVLGDKMVEKIRVNTGSGSEELAVAGVFAYIGLEPNAAFVPEAVKRDATGRLVTGDTLETTLPGLWAAGAVRCRTQNAPPKPWPRACSKGRYFSGAGRPMLSRSQPSCPRRRSVSMLSR